MQTRRQPILSEHVFEQPPRETESSPAEEADVSSSTLGGSMDMPGQPSETQVPAWQAAGLPPPQPGLKSSEELGLGSRESTSAIATARNSNLRRTSHPGKIILAGIVLNVIALAGVGWWFQRQIMATMEERIATIGATQQQHSTAAPATAAPELSKLEAQLGDSFSRLASLEGQNKQLSTRVEELSAALAAAKSEVQKSKSGSASRSSAAPPPSPLGEDLSPSQQELILLKERNRLTGFADECIATGARVPYERLWEAMADPRLANLTHAARSEILRVQNFYLGGSRIDRYDIPVGTYFPDDAALRDSQLKDEQLIKLVREKKNPWEVRMKAANLLGMRRSLEIGDALVETVKLDENLDVVKEATFSFEQMTGFHSRLFDTDALEQWWKQFKALPTPPKPKAKAPDKAAKGSENTPPATMKEPAPPTGKDGKDSPPASVKEAPPASVKEAPKATGKQSSPAGGAKAPASSSTPKAPTSSTPKATKKKS